MHYVCDCDFVYVVAGDILMTIKIQTKEWECSNQCGSDCCSDIFLPMPPQYRKMFEEHRYWITDNNYTDWDWLSYHKSIVIEKLAKGHRKLYLTGDTAFEFIFNPFRGYDELYISEQCSKLLPNHKCKIFRARPVICRRGQCVVFSKNPELNHYAIKGKLRDVYETEESKQM
jgi:hypothetical protein